MHEVGHNSKLNHASEGGAEYGVLTGVMGAHFGFDDQLMCYNAPNMYQQGCLTTVTEFTYRLASGNYVLVGHTNFGGGIQAIRLLQGTPSRMGKDERCTRLGSTFLFNTISSSSMNPHDSQG
jgi:hypothetical protein